MENSDVSLNPSGGEMDARGAIEPALETDLRSRVLSPENQPPSMATSEVKSRRARHRRDAD
jgi:hypothetical protein